MLLNHDIALGISDEVDMFGLKGSKKRKGKKQFFKEIFGLYIDEIKDEFIRKIMFGMI